MPDEELRMTLGEHLEELRRCLLRALLGVAVGMVVCLCLGKVLFKVIFWPLSVATAGRPENLYFHSLPEAFSTYLRVCLIGGAILAGPYSLHQIWRFVAAGLYETERRAVRKYLLPSIALFALGVAFFFACVAPVIVRFFLVFGQTSFPSPPDVPEWLGRWLGEYTPGGQGPATQPASSGAFVRPWLTLSEYVSFTALLSLVFGLAFQTPLVVIFLARSGIVTIDAMRRLRRYVLLVILIISAILTPSDVYSMIALAVPIYLLYELGLVLARGKGRKEVTG